MKKYLSLFVTLLITISSINIIFNEKIESVEFSDNDLDYEYVMTVVESSTAPIITKNHPGSAGNVAGYENGHVIKTDDGKYHMLITEMFVDGNVAGQKHWSPARIAHWISDDGDSWVRHQQIVQGNAIYQDPKENTWSPSWYWNASENRWNIFWRGSNSVFRYRADTPGINGITGTYSEVNQIIPPMGGEIKSHWDYDGIAAFSNVYTASDGKLYAFYGLVNQQLTYTNWYNALAYADDVDGPWTRVSKDFPDLIFSENPYIYEYDGMYFAVYDDLSYHHSIGYAWSEDGINWTSKTLDLQGHTNWVSQVDLTASVRTPMSLIKEANGNYTIFFTGHNSSRNYYEVGKISVSMNKVYKSPSQETNLRFDDIKWKPNQGQWVERYGEYVQANKTLTTANTSIQNKKFKDLDIEVELKMPESSTNANVWAGIHFRKTNIDDGPTASGYMAYVTRTGQVNLYRGTTRLAFSNTGKNPYIYRKLRVVAIGNNIKVYYDGVTTPVINVTDSNFSNGYLGLNTSRTACHFKNIDIKDHISFSYPHGVWNYSNQQLSSTPDGGHYVAEIINTEGLADFEITYNMFVHDWMGWHGLNFRRENSSLQSWATGYTVQMSHGSDPVNLLKGTSSVATGSQINPWIMNQWTKVNVRVQGKTLEVYINDQPNPVITYDSLTIDRGTLAFTTDQSNGVTIKDIKLEVKDVPLFKYPHGIWTYQNGELASTKDAGHYVAEFVNTSDLTDFEITYDMYVHDWMGWHGLNFRREINGLKSWETGYTVKMHHGGDPAWHSTQLLKNGNVVATGGIINPWLDKQWTKVNIKVEGSNLTVYVNDQATPVLTYDSLSIEKGALAFTTHASNGMTVKDIDLKTDFTPPETQLGLFTYPHGVWDYQNGELASTKDAGHYVAEYANTSELKDFEIIYDMYVHDWMGWHGLNFRREDSSMESFNTGYTVEFKHGDHNVILRKGLTTVATGTGMPSWPKDRWTNISIKVEGTNIDVRADGVQVLTYNSLSISKGSLAYTTHGSNGMTIRNVKLDVKDKKGVSLGKNTEGDFIVEIAGVNPYYSYQIWALEQIESDVFGSLRDWSLLQPYKKAYLLENYQGKIFSNVGPTINTPDMFYTVSVKVVDGSGKYLGQLKDTFTLADVGEVVIEKVEVDNEFADERPLIKDISDNTVSVKMFTNITENVTYSAVVNPGNLNLGIVDSNFNWDISGYLPGNYTLTLMAQNNNTSDERDIKFRLFKSDPSIIYASFGSNRPQVQSAANPWSFIFDANNKQTSPVGILHRYTLSEPWTTLRADSGKTIDSAATVNLQSGQYGIYHAITRIYRPDSNTVDDGAIATVRYDRAGIDNLALNVNLSGPPTKGLQVSFDPVISGGTLTGAKYSFWRRDASGWRLIRDYDDGGITWTPARVGDYTIQVRARGTGAGSYELVQNVDVNVTDDNDTTLTVGDIGLTWSDNPTSRRPVTLNANAVNPATDDVLYKFIISDGYLFYIETGYSPSPSYTFISGAARDYRVSVLVKNQKSFGKYDAVKTFTIPVVEP